MHVILATDGSANARAATQWLKDLPLPPDAEVLALTVAALPSPPVPPPTMGNLRDAALADARRIGDDALERLTPRWPKAQLRVTEGDAREEIVRIAEEWDADLIVMGARGLRRVKGFFLGSVSLAVARHAPCSVAVVKGAPRRLRSAVVGVDGSEHSLRAVKFLARMDQDKSLRVSLLGVVERLRFPSSAPSLLHGPLLAALAQEERERRSALQACLDRAKVVVEPSVGAVEVSVVTGLPAAEITRLANSDGRDLVVLGARGLGPVKRLLLGSVSEQVLRDARCPVLIVKRPGGGEP